MKTVYLNDRIDQNAIERLKRHVRLVNNFDHPEEIDAIIVRQQYCTKEIIEKVKNCKLIQMHGVGLERIDVEAAKEAGIPVLNTRGGNAKSVVELAMGLLLALSRKLTYINDGVKKGKFSKFGLPETEGNEVTGKVLGLVGGGQIARMMGQVMKLAFNNRVLVYDPFLEKEECQKYGFEKVDDLKELFSQVDFVSIHVPLTNSTKHMINKEIFQYAKENLILVNTARGGVVDEGDLYEALINGKIKAAGMDVFESQPPQLDNPLLQLDNFISTLHIGGSTAEALKRNGQIVVDHIFEALGIEE